MKIEMKSVVEIDVEMLANLFAGLDDDEQARFFVAVAKHFREFGDVGFEMQANYIGGHLRNCSCSTEDARELIRSIAAAVETSKHGLHAEASHTEAGAA